LPWLFVNNLPLGIFHDLRHKLANMSQPGRLTVRAAVLTGFSDLCRSMGVDPAPILRAAGLGVTSEAEPDRRVAIAAVARAVELAALASRREDFGLELAQRRGFSNMGPVGLLARDEPTVGAAMATIETHLPIHNEALVITHEDHGDLVVVRIAVLGVAARTQVNVVAVAALFRVMRQLAGSDWAPEEISLTCPAPRDDRPFRRMFGDNLRFGAAFDGVTVRTDLLARPNRLADAVFHRFAPQAVRIFAPAQTDLMTSRVQRVLPALLSYRRCTAAHVATQLGVSRRTLTRQLADEGASFLVLLDDLRSDIARSHLGTRSRRLGDIADMLGFSSPAAFSTWFRRCHGVTPRDWQKAQAGVSSIGRQPT
jgi:AraC-like DNA-binding protein